MKSDLTDVIADLVLKSAPGLASRLDYQAETLLEARCIEPMLGRWIESNAADELLSAFALEDNDFAARFPTMTHLSGEERYRVVATIENHFEQCPHCSLQREYDLELDTHIEQALQQNDELLLQLLEEDEADSSAEAEDQETELKPAVAESQ